jgi:hypothetical protein
MPRPSVLRLDALLAEQGEAFAHLLTESLQAVLEGEMTAFLGATAGERTHARTGHRAGHRRHGLLTRIGKVELRVPRDRERRFTTELFDRYARAEQRFIAALAAMHARGVTAARVKDIVEALCGHALSARAIEQVVQGLDDALVCFARSSMHGVWPCVALHAQRGRVRIDGIVRSCVVRTAVGMDRDGRTRVLDVDLLMRQRRQDWKGLLRGLKQRGLGGARTVVVGDDDDATTWRAARGMLDPGWLRARDDALAYKRAARRAATGRGESPSMIRSPGLRPRWRVAQQGARDAVDAQSWAPQQLVAHGPEVAAASSPRPIDAATALPVPAPVVAEAATREVVTPAPVPHRGAASRATPLFDPRRLAARAAELIGPAIVWAGVGAAVVLTGVLFWNIDAPGTSPEALASDPAPASPARSLASPAPFPSPQVSVVPSAVTPQPAVSRYQLSGVLAAARADGPGIALISIDGGSAQAFRVGAAVDGDLVLKGVSPSGATLGTASGPATVRLEVTYGAAPANPLRHASEGSTWPVSVAQASPPDDGGAAQHAWAIAASPQGMPGSAGTLQAVTTTAQDVAAQPATDLVPDALPTRVRPSPGRRMRLHR